MVWFRQTPKLLVLYLASSSPFSWGLATASPLQSSSSYLTPTNFMFSSTTSIQSPLWSSTSPAACQVSLSIPLLIYLLSLLCTSCTWNHLSQASPVWSSQHLTSSILVTAKEKPNIWISATSSSASNLCHCMLFCFFGSIPLKSKEGHYLWLRPFHSRHPFTNPGQSNREQAWHMCSNARAHLMTVNSTCQYNQMWWIQESRRFYIKIQHHRYTYIYLINVRSILPLT